MHINRVVILFFLMNEVFEFFLLHLYWFNYYNMVSEKEFCWDSLIFFHWLLVVFFSLLSFFTLSCHCFVWAFFFLFMASNPSISTASSSQNGKYAIDDPFSPDFLHHSNNPGLVLVSQQLTGENYSSWTRAMVIALSVKNKIGFIDGLIPRLDGTDLILLNSWTRNNNIVISWILNSVSTDISTSILFFDSVFKIWTDLRDRFQ